MREFARLLRHLFNGQLLQIRRQQFVKPAGANNGRQPELGAIVGAPVPKSYRREQRDSVQIHLMALLQHVR